jgi:glucose/arabinose dehydrogenase
MTLRGVVAFGVGLSLVVGFVATSTASAQAASYHRETVFGCRPLNPDCWPTAIAFSPSGKIFFVERYTGQIRVFNPDTDSSKHWITLDNVSTSGEQGILGIALDPRWPEKKWVYIYYTRDNNGEPQNRIIRVRKRDDGSFVRERLAKIQADSIHNGGVIHIGPDGKLYAVTGDAGNKANAQDTDVRAGKILRLNKDGSVPSDNPFPGSHSFSYGHRNSFGFSFDHNDPNPNTVEVWQTENGPSCNDEINFGEAGKNYGWGADSDDCNNTNISGPNPEDPVYAWFDVVVPTGAAFCQKCGLGEALNGHLLVGDYSGGKFWNLTLSANRTEVVSAEPLDVSGSFNVLAVEKKPTTRKIFFSDYTGIYRLERD